MLISDKGSISINGLNISTPTHTQNLHKGKKSVPCWQDQQLKQPHIFFLNPEYAAQLLEAAYSTP